MGVRYFGTDLVPLEPYYSSRDSRASSFRYDVRRSHGNDGGSIPNSVPSDERRRGCSFGRYRLWGVGSIPLRPGTDDSGNPGLCLHTAPRGIPARVSFRRALKNNRFS